MLASLPRWVLVPCLLLAACNGDVEPDPSSASGASSGAGAAPAGAGGTGSGAAGANGGAGGSNATVGVGGTGGVGDDCENVPDYLANLLAAAAACNPATSVPHCQVVVDGFCCPVVVESASSPATQAYLDFLHLTQQQCPQMWQTCNAVDCAQPVPGLCEEQPGGTGLCDPYGL